MINTWPITFMHRPLWFPCRKKGGGKAGKGDKKGAKDASIKSMSVANSNLWEARLEVADLARTKYRYHHSCFVVQLGIAVI